MKNLFAPKFGLDIGSRKISGVKLEKKKGKVSVKDFFYYDLANSNKEYPVKKKTKNALCALVEMNKLKNTKTAVCMPDEMVISFNMYLPDMPKKEIAEAVKNELQSRLQTTLDKITYDYVITPMISKDAHKKFKIAVFCTSKESVQVRMKMLKDCQLKPSVLEPDMIAHTATLEFNDYFEDGSSHVIIDLGESHTSIGVVVDGVLQATKSSEIGYGKINKSLEERLGIDYKESEKIKLGYDFNDGENGNTQAKELIDEVCFQIFREIKESIEYFTDHIKITSHVDKLFLVGGASQQKNIKQIFEMFFKIPTVVPNPFKKIDLYSGQGGAIDDSIGFLSPYMSVAVGLALRGVEK